MDSTITDKYLHDKASWRRGPWDTEPDQRFFYYKGYPCLIWRGSRLGIFCGYVGIPLGSKYEDEDNYNNLVVHGGVTWYRASLPDRIEYPELNEPKFWLGFDCAHYGDLLPVNTLDSCMPPHLRSKYENPFQDDEEIYRDIEFVEKELKELVDQIIKEEK